MATSAYAGGPEAAPMSSLVDPWTLMFEASIPVKVVLVVLSLFSAVSWVIIVTKTLQFAAAKRASVGFFDSLRTAPTLDAFAGQAARFRGSPLGRAFAACYNALSDPTSAIRQPEFALQTMLRRSVTDEMAGLESGLSVLGTIGSTAPFIGLFGTVYGILDAFLQIGQAESASLSVVAPKIAEALIATAVGLVAAIPSVMAYNAFVRKADRWTDELDAFAEAITARVHARS